MEQRGRKGAKKRIRNRRRRERKRREGMGRRKGRERCEKPMAYKVNNKGTIHH